MADNPFAKKTDDQKQDDAKAKPDGKGNPFAKKMTGKHPPKRKAKKKPARKSRLQKFGRSY